MKSRYIAECVSFTKFFAVLQQPAGHVTPFWGASATIISQSQFWLQQANSSISCPLCSVEPRHYALFNGPCSGAIQHKSCCDAKQVVLFPLPQLCNAQLMSHLTSARKSLWNSKVYIWKAFSNEYFQKRTYLESCHARLTTQRMKFYRFSILAAVQWRLYWQPWPALLKYSVGKVLRKYNGLLTVATSQQEHVLNPTWQQCS